MSSERTFAVATFGGLEDNSPRRDAWSLQQLLLAMSRFSVRTERDGPLWSPTEYPSGAKRNIENVAHVTCLVLDFDRGHAPEDLVQHWRERGLWFVTHSTWRHTDEHPRWRAVFPLARPVPAAEWPKTHARLVRRLAEGLTDPACKDCSRIYFLPAAKPGAPKWSEGYEGDPLDPGETFEDMVGDPPDDEPAPTPKRPKPEGQETPGDWYERTAEWRTLLEGVGGQYVRRSGRREEYVRPGKSKRDGISATTGNGRSGQDLLKVHTSNWPPFETGEVLTKFGCYTRLHHGGDFAAAIAAIKAMPDYPRDDEGGSPARRKALDLPPGPPLGIPDGPWPPNTAPGTVDVVDEPDPDRPYWDPLQKRHRKFSVGDVGNAERFVHWFGQDMRYVAGHGWYVYDGGHWKTSDEGAVAARRLSMRVADRVMLAGVAERDEDRKKELYALGGRLLNKKSLDPMLTLAAAFPQVEARLSDFDRDPYVLGVGNGVVELRTGKLRPSSPDEMITMRAGCDYDPDAECPTFLVFLEQIMLGREDLMRFLMLSLAYSLSGSIRTRAFWFLTGTGGNGKGALIRLIGQIAGDYATTLMTESVMVKKGEQIPADIAKLHGKRFVSVGEVNDEKRLNEPLIKTLSGFDPITARFLNQNFFDFTPCAKIWLAGNQRPQVRNFDRAMRQRMRVVPFELDLPVAEQDGDLHHKLWAEAPGILALIVKAFAEFERSGLPETEAVEEATDAYQASTDTVESFLEEECDRTEEDSRTPKVRLFKAYVQWCRDNQVRPLGKHKLYDRLDKLGLKTSSTYWNGAHPFLGIRLLGDGEYGTEGEA